MTGTEGSIPAIDWTAVAEQKVCAVLGRARGEALVREVLSELGRGSTLRSAEDLYAFSQVLIRRGGFAGATGSLLSVYAVMHGARSWAGLFVRRAHFWRARAQTLFTGSRRVDVCGLDGRLWGRILAARTLM